MYNISIEGRVAGDKATPRSNEILAHTDYDSPGSPIITNITCVDSRSIYIEWIRPKVGGSYVDIYKIFYGPSNTPLKEISIKAASEDRISKVIGA